MFGHVATFGLALPWHSLLSSTNSITNSCSEGFVGYTIVSNGEYCCSEHSVLKARRVVSGDIFRDVRPFRQKKQVQKNERVVKRTLPKTCIGNLYRHHSYAYRRPLLFLPLSVP